MILLTVKKKTLAHSEWSSYNTQNEKERETRECCT